jgi:2-oxoisovalerate dehydrogenase E1 component
MSANVEMMPDETTNISSEQLISAFREMFRSRLVDSKAIILYKQNKCHFQIGCAGHEAIQVAVAHAMRPKEDWAYPYYRDMAFVSAFGMSNREHFLSILNKAKDPNSGGRQMPMHYGSNELNIVNQSSPTGTQFLQAVGAAYALKREGSDNVVYVSSGEGTTSQGDWHEALNWAARDKLPVIFVIQDNKYAISVHVSEQTAGGSVAKIAQGYENLDVLKVNGLDYTQSFETAQSAIERARAGEGPTVIVADVVRLQSHSISDNHSKYRSEEDISAEQEKDPIKLFRAYLLERQIISPAELQSLEKELRLQVDEDAQWAENEADPAPETFDHHVYVDPNPARAVTERPIRLGESLFPVDAINRALREEMARDERIIVFGQDVAGGKGGVFSATAGLTDAFGRERCFNSPLAESSIIGAAIGMATLGLRPVVEIQFGDYIWTAMMQVRNELALMNYRSNGAFTCPVIVRVAVGGYIHGAVYHSQNIEATFSHFPGLHVVLASNARDAKGLLKTAIRGSDPVLVLEHKGLYRQVYAKCDIGDDEDLIPIGKASIAREGKDATIVSWGALVQKSLVAADILAKEGVEVEVVDIRSMSPLDMDTILTSVRKTNRLLIAQEDVLFMGFASEIAAQVSEQAFEYLDAPVKRVGGAFTPIPHAPILEKQVLPQNDDVIKALRELLSY